MHSFHILTQLTSSTLRFHAKYFLPLILVLCPYTPSLLILFEHLKCPQDCIHTVLSTKPLFQFSYTGGTLIFRINRESIRSWCNRHVFSFLLCFFLYNGKDDLLEHLFIWDYRGMDLRCFFAADIVQDCICNELRLTAPLPIEQIDHRLMLMVIRVESNRKFSSIFFICHAFHRSPCWSL